MGGGLAAAAAAAVKREGKVCAGLSKHHVPPPGHQSRAQELVPLVASTIGSHRNPPNAAGAPKPSPGACRGQGLWGGVSETRLKQ